MQKLAQISILFSTFFAVWSTSGTRPLAGSIMLIISVLCFVFSILNWGFNQKSTSILKNPFFIGGGILILLGLIQVLNPHTIAYDADGYLHARTLDYIKWLPSGIKADAEVYSSAKAVAELLSAYFFATALWFHSKDTKFCKILIKFFALNVFAMSIFAIVQKYLKAQAIYFLFSTDSIFYGPYYYTNATCAAIFLGLCASIGALCLDFNFANDVKSKCLSLLWILTIIPELIAIFISSSIGAKMSVLIFALLLIAIAIFYLLKRKIGSKKSIIILLFLISISAYPIFTIINSRYENLNAIKKTSLNGRLELANIAKNVFFESPIFGNGADSFGYVATKYKKENSFTKFANSAHNSILNYACEYGLVGILSILLVFGSWLKKLYLRRNVLCGANIVFIAGFATSTIHSMSDIFLQIPSTMWFYTITMTLCASILQKVRNG